MLIFILGLLLKIAMTASTVVAASLVERSGPGALLLARGCECLLQHI